MSLRRAGERVKGAILFRKREWPHWNPKRKALIGSLGLDSLYASGMRIPARGVAALGVARRFDYLLLSAAALPIL